jgi:excisionase family DNA binding protein
MVVQLTTEQLTELIRSAVRDELRGQPISTKPAVLDSEEAATLLRLPVDTLRKRVRAGEIPSFKIGSLLRFRVAELDQWIAEQKGSR